MGLQVRVLSAERLGSFLEFAGSPRRLRKVGARSRKVVAVVVSAGWGGGEAVKEGGSRWWCLVSSQSPVSYLRQPWNVVEFEEGLVAIWGVALGRSVWTCGLVARRGLKPLTAFDFVNWRVLELANTCPGAMGMIIS